MQPQPVRGYRFAGFTLDLTRRRLSGHGQDSIVLSGRAFEVLAFLLSRRDRMVTKRELLDAVWPHLVVEENNLTQAISTLRRVLGDSREAPQFIATIAGRGYQFVGDAVPVADAAPEPDTALPATSLASPGQSSPPPPSSEPVTSPQATTPESKVVSRRVLLGSAGAAAVVVAAGAAWLLRPKPTSRLPASIAVLPFKPLLSTSRNEATA
jgi:DNA-binding winged helix-turn-helix (wHTH) protein